MNWRKIIGYMNAAIGIACLVIAAVSLHIIGLTGAALICASGGGWILGTGLYIIKKST